MQVLNFFNFSSFVIPKAVAASSNDGSISDNPVIVLCSIGNIAYITNATTAGNVPIPVNGINKPSNAREGIVWKIPVICKNHSLVFLFPEIITPNGTAIKIAIISDNNEI